MAHIPDQSHPGGSAIPATPVGPGRYPLLFEVAWEACAQVGGIYTVLRSKAPATVRRWQDHYCLIGPYREASARVELEPQLPPDTLKPALHDLTTAGVRWHFGRWLITGRPQVLLLDIGSALPRLAAMKYLLWKDNGIGSPDGDRDFDEVVALGFVVADFLASLRRHAPQRPILAHFHEWQGGAALPRLRHNGVPVATVFTTHATLVGRSLSSCNAELYEHIDHINAGEVAYRHGFGHRHAVEGAAAVSADVFTTVSSITGLEAARFLGRRPDVLLPNGLNVERFAAPHEFQNLHRRNKELIHEFVMGHFFPSYSFDLDHTLYFFTAGRYEYRNKGLDVFIEALAELNGRMRAEGSATTVVAFIITRAPYRALNVDTLNRQAMFNELHDTCDAIREDMGVRLFQSVARGRLPTLDDLLDEYAAVRLKRMMFASRSNRPPAIVTHDLVDDAHDPVLCHLRARQLVNLAEDRVKVIFHPEFMSATSPLLGMEYDQFIRGCHAGVFPSYYEPWGYTPLECVVSGIPAITSDLSGFGDYVMQKFPTHDQDGMWVARRRGRSFQDTVGQVAGWLYDLTRMSRRERIGLRNRVEAHAEHFDWNILGRHYAEAHRLALERQYGPDAAVPVDPDFDTAPAPVLDVAPQRPATRQKKAVRTRAATTRRKA